MVRNYNSKSIGYSVEGRRTGREGPKDESIELNSNYQRHPIGVVTATIILNPFQTGESEGLVWGLKDEAIGAGGLVTGSQC